MSAPSAAGLTLRASLRYFVRQPGQLALAVLGLAVGVAAVMSVESARGTIAESFADFVGQRDGAATHRIEAGDGWLRDEEYLDLRQRFGGLPLAPVLSLRLRDAAGQAWQVLGVDPLAERRVRTLTRDALADPAFPLVDWLASEPLMLAPVGAGPALTLADGTRLVRAGDLPAAVGGRLVVVDLSLAQALAGRNLADFSTGSLSYLDLVADTDQARAVAAALPPRLRLVALSDGDTTAVSRAFEINLLALSLLALLVGAFIVFNTMRFFVLQRRHLFGLQRLLGMTRRQVAHCVLTEALLIGLLGTLLGIALGLALADGVLRQMAGTVNALYYEVTAARARIGLAEGVKAAAVGVGGALLAALWPALEASRVTPRPRPLAALTGGTLRTMVVAGLLALAAAALCFRLPWLLAALASVFLAALGYVLLVIPACARLLGRWRPPLLRAPVGAFAASRLPFTLNRTAAAVAALLLAVATVVGVDHMIHSFRTSVVDWLEVSLSADAYVAVRDDSRRLPADLLADIDARPGIAQTAGFLTRSVTTGASAITLSAQRLNERARQSFRFQGDWPEDGWQRWQREDLALLSETLARRLALGAGDRLTLPTPDGAVALTVLAVFSDYRADGGRVVVSHTTYQRHWGAAGLTSVGLYFAPGQGAAEQAWLDRRLAAEPALRMAPTAEIRRESLRVFDRTFDLTRGLKWLAAVVAFVGVLGAVMALQLERRGESELLATLGMGPADRARLLALEALGVGLAAGLLALPLGALLAWMLTDVINLRAFGWVLNVRWHPPTFALGLGLAVAAAMLGAAGSIRSVLRGRDRLAGTP